MEAGVKKIDALRWRQVKAILADALEFESPQAQLESVRQACRDDTALGREVEALLIEADCFDECAERAPTVLHYDAEAERGARLGAYRILELLGSGGMGTVYLAERADGQFEKKVALKILKRGTDTDAVLRRFAAERQILARMEHPNIARLLDAGTTPDGLPYLVMEYVEGGSLTEWIRQQRLNIPARLDLFLKVCAAVQFAHDRRVIHRDLKPANILVQSNGEPKLLDFGIAKLIEPRDESDVTHTLDRRMTAACASPEQARGEVITQLSDVYSLGALLYEVLTGSAPHRFATSHPSAQEVARVISDEEPTPPSAIISDPEQRRAVRGDLENIVLFAMRKEPGRRYKSVRDLADDIERYRAARPVAARPCTLGYRAGRFLRRNRREMFYLVSLMGVALLFALVLYRVSPEKERVGLESATAAPLTTGGIAVMPFEILSKETVTPAFAEGIEENIIAELSKMRTLRVIARTSVSNDGSSAVDPREIQRTLRVAHLLRGTVQRSGDRLRLNVALIDTATGAQIWSNHFDRTVTDLFELQSDLATQVASQLHPTLAPTEITGPAKAPTRDFAAYELFVRARSILHTPAGRQNYRAATVEAIQLLGDAIARDPDFAEAHSLLGTAHLDLYRFYYDRTPERLALAKSSIDAAMRIAPDAGASRLAQARYLCFGLRDFAAAYRELAAAKLQLGNDPDFLELSAVTRRRLGDWSGAVADGEKAADLDPRQPWRRLQLAESYIALRRFSDAEALADRAIAALAPQATEAFWLIKSTAAIGRGDLPASRFALEQVRNPTPEVRFRMARVFLLEHRFADAASALDQLIAEQPDTSRLHSVRGFVARLMGDESRAQAEFSKVRDLLRNLTAQNSEDSNVWLSLALAHAALGEKEDALDAAKKAMQLAPPEHDEVDGPVAQTWMAQIYLKVGKPEAALDLLTHLSRKACGPLFGDLKFDPTWDSLRNDPRFSTILRAAVLPPDGPPRPAE